MKNYKEARKLAVKIVGEANLIRAARMYGMKNAVASILADFRGNEYYAEKIAKVL